MSTFSHTAYDDIVSFLARINPSEVLAFHSSDKTQQRVEWLLERKHKTLLSANEQEELTYFLMLEHIIRLAKARALKNLH